MNLQVLRKVKYVKYTPYFLYSIASNSLFYRLRRKMLIISI